MFRVIWRCVRVVLQRLNAVPFATAIGLVGVNSAVNLLLYPQRSSIHALASPWDYAWAGIYGAGGLMIVTGISVARMDVEAAGCVAFGGGAIINAVVVAAIAGWASWNVVLILSVFAWASLARGWHITQGRVLILVEVKDGIPTITSPGGEQ
jgi:hypothetical protein